jgi:four helix bundle suffix protein
MKNPEKSDGSDASDRIDGLLPKHGGYRRLRSFQTAQLVYDGTVIFCNRFIDKRSRTHDQMVQAARSGVQNIAEGSVASGTSKKTELKLTNVARASLEELLLDYEDFLRQRGFRLWPKDSPEALAVRGRYQSAPADTPDSPNPPDPYSLRTASPEVAANTLICLINQASYLLGRQLENLEQQFLQRGGFTERLYAARTQARQRQAEQPSSQVDSTAQSNTTPPGCPRCGKPMILRTARQGSRAGQPFWGCPAYPDCTGTRPADSGPAPTGEPDRPARPVQPKPRSPKEHES